MKENDMIFKYTLKSVDDEILELPKYAEILSAQVQNEKICLWVSFREANKESLEKRLILVIGTGNPFDLKYKKFIGTVQLLGGSFVGHVFEDFSNLYA